MLTKPGVPIIFFHVGDRRFADIALRQAAMAAANSDIILLTDWPRPSPIDMRQVAVGDYLDNARAFGNIYEHISVNAIDFEVRCFLRWFIIRDFARRHGMEKFCVFDTDVMLFSSVEDFAAEFAGFAAGNWAWANYFAGVAALDTMCEHFMRVFRDRALLGSLAAKYGQGLGRPHLSDMYLIHDLPQLDSGFLDQKVLLAKGFDSNIRESSGGYVMNGPIKHLTIGADGVPVGRRHDGEAVPFKFLHFQGSAKMLMKRLAWSSGDSIGRGSFAAPEQKPWILSPPEDLPAFPL